jgi:geranylgeranyl diphosphate synthase type II
MAHAASLILDDLPCMDDARLRRGRPANHIAFGEDIALLAAFGLLNHAYGLIGDAPQIGFEARARLVSLMSRSIGLHGLIGGQEQDLRGTAESPNAISVGDVHSRKTGALFVAAAEAGAIVAGASRAHTDRILEFAARLGMAFQTLDDFVDAFACTTSAGKDTHQDTDRPNLVTMVGRDRALKSLVLHVQRATDAIEPFGDGAMPLGQLAQSLVDGAFLLSESVSSSPAAAQSY